MTRHTQQVLVRSVVVLVSALAFVVGFGAPASAGGWAVASLDEVPTPMAGETTDVGFRILQHGVTPVDLTEDVGIELIAADGSTTYFPATLDGATGHYVATVTFPDAAGSYAWTVQMGWFGPQSLGSVTVAAPAVPAAPAVKVVPSAPQVGAELVGAPADATTVTSSDTSAWSVARWVVLAAAVLLAGVAVADFVSSRRRGEVALG